MIKFLRSNQWLLYDKLPQKGLTINMLRTQIQIEENQIKWLRDKAKERGVSVSQLIREGVEFYRKYEERIPEDKKKKALAAIGRYASGVSDISEKHDDYLAKAFQSELSHGN